MAKQQLNSQQMSSATRQGGWGYFQGDGTNVQFLTFNFPTSFTTTPTKFTITCLGYRLTSNGVPTAITGFQQDFASYINGAPISNTQAKLASIGRDSSTLNGTNVYIGYSWTAEV
jgi:hypothetical protein